MCGEKSSSSSRLSCASGSPPRMRGKESGCVPGLPGSRITPAHAGKRDKTAIFEEWCRDHPCVCGEKTKPVPAGGILMGSPPRVRGKVRQHLESRQSVGITPACAGKRIERSQCRTSRRDHPRACGEKRVGSLASVGLSGSPPRVRGKACRCPPLDTNQRITPACAGKSSLRWAAIQTHGDHPRVCGEKFHPASDRKLGRVRGTKRSSGPAPAAAPAGLAGSCPASPPWSYPPRITVSRPRP